MGGPLPILLRVPSFFVFFLPSFVIFFFLRKAVKRRRWRTAPNSRRRCRPRCRHSNRLERLCGRFFFVLLERRWLRVGVPPCKERTRRRCEMWNRSAANRSISARWEPSRAEPKRTAPVEPLSVYGPSLSAPNPKRSTKRPQDILRPVRLVKNPIKTHCNPVSPGKT